MINNFFAVTCDQFNLGTTFLIWSIYYCADKKGYYSIRDDQFKTIPSNPFDGMTAHQMKPNTVYDLDHIVKDTDQPGDSLKHIRFFPDASYLDTGVVSNKPFLEKVQKLGIRSVNITCTGLQFLIGFLRDSYTQPRWQQDFDAVKKHCKHYWPTFFDDAHIYENQLQTWHDIREGIAFNIRPYQFPTMEKNANTYDCQIQDLLDNGKNELLNILQFLKIGPHTPNLDHWCAMHKIWKEYFQHYIFFCNDVETIVECILHKKPLDLEKYQMDVLKEGVLLHLLMFKHNLNLNESIEKLPPNTQEISELLRKNNRTGIQKIY